jgi:hypothetical protein
MAKISNTVRVASAPKPKIKSGGTVVRIPAKAPRANPPGR